MLQKGTVCKIKGPDKGNEARWPMETKNWKKNKDWMEELTVAVKGPGGDTGTIVVKILDLGRYNGRKFRYSHIELPIEFLTPVAGKQALDMGEKWELVKNEMTGELVVAPKKKSK